MKVNRAHSLFHIWFTTNPSDPLGKPVNWDRIANWRAVHPASEYNLSIVISKGILNKDGLEKLEILKNTHHITVVDVVDIKANNSTENFLLNFAKNEIKKGRSLEGDPVGHFTLASDILRFMRYLLQKYGIYSDLDGFMNLQSLEDGVLDAISFFMPINNSCLWVKSIHHPAIDVFQQLQYCNLLLEDQRSYKIRHADSVESKLLRERVVRLTGLVGLFDIWSGGDVDERDAIGMWNKYAKDLLHRDSNSDYGNKSIFFNLFKHDDDWTKLNDDDFRDVSVACTKKVRLDNHSKFSMKRFVDIMCDAITEIDTNPTLSEEEVTRIKSSIFEHKEAENQYEYVLWFAAYLQQKPYLTSDEIGTATNNALNFLTLSKQFDYNSDQLLRLFSAAATYLKTLNFYCLKTIDVSKVTKKWKSRDLTEGWNTASRFGYCQWALLLMSQYQYATPEQKEEINAALELLQNHQHDHPESPSFKLTFYNEDIKHLNESVAVLTTTPIELISSIDTTGNDKAAASLDSVENITAILNSAPISNEPPATFPIDTQATSQARLTPDLNVGTQAIAAENNIETDARLKEINSLILRFEPYLKEVKDLRDEQIEHHKEPFDTFICSIRSALNELKSNNNLEQFMDMFNKAVSDVKKALENEPGIWRNLHPIIKGMLGVLAALTIIPAVIISATQQSQGGFYGTFFTKAETAASKAWNQKNLDNIPTNDSQSKIKR